jgi:nuclease S1
MTDRPTTRAIALFTTLALAIASTHSALAWGPQGHRVIARVAEERLTPAAKAAIKELLHPGDTLPDVAGWADKEGHDAVPGSASWHYINVPIGDARFDPKLIRNENNVVVKIKHYRKILADKSQPKQERQRALLFLVHFVSDIHQPLHVGDNNDHGGNDTQIQFFTEGTNLHKLWDSDLIHKIGGNDQAWVHRVEQDIKPDFVKEWSKGSVDDWANETLQVAKLAYRPLDDAPKVIPRGFKLDEAYVKRAEPILKEQMARASVRLANELNAIFR